MAGGNCFLVSLGVFSGRPISIMELGKVGALSFTSSTSITTLMFSPSPVRGMADRVYLSRVSLRGIDDRSEALATSRSSRKGGHRMRSLGLRRFLSALKFAKVGSISPKVCCKSYGKEVSLIPH